MNYKILIPAIAIVGALGGLIGFFAKPAKIVETQKLVVQEKEVIKVVEVEKLIEAKSKDTDQNKDTHKVTVSETKPDGSTKVTETVDETVNTKTKEAEIKYVDRIKEVEVEKIVEKKVETTKIVENDKDWHAALMLGTSTSGFSVTPTAPWINPLILGVEVDRRIIGPVTLGLWGQTTTQFNSFAGGLSVGARW